MPDLSPRLDYTASVPMEEKSPFSVNVNPDQPPGQRLVDYKPSPSKQAEIERRQQEPVQREPKPHSQGVVVEPNATFVSRKDMDKRLENRRKQILEIAKRIYQEKRVRRLEYERAMKTLKNMTKHEKENPNETQARALKIVDRGHPMTKQMALDLAKKQVLQEIRSRSM